MMSYTVRPEILPCHRLDWLALHVHHEEHGGPEPRIALMPWGDRLEPVKPRLGYGRGWSTPQGVIWLDAAPQAAMGQHIIISGGALDDMAAGLGDEGVRRWVQGMVTWHRARPVRVDVAYDCETLPPLSIVQAYASGNLLKRSPSQPQCVTSRRQQGMGTVTVGARGSGAYVRLYDKADEQAGVQECAYGDLAPWYRLEYELREQAAQAVLDAWLATDWRRVAGVCSRVLSVREPNPADTNTSRWPIAPAWRAVLGTTTAYEPPPNAHVPGSPEQAVRWVLHDGGRALAAAAEILGPHLGGWLQDNMAARRERWTDAEWAAIAAARDEYNQYRQGSDLGRGVADWLARRNVAPIPE